MELYMYFEPVYHYFRIMNVERLGSAGSVAPPSCTILSHFSLPTKPTHRKQHGAGNGYLPRPARSGLSFTSTAAKKQSMSTWMIEGMGKNRREIMVSR